MKTEFDTWLDTFDWHNTFAVTAHLSDAFRYPQDHKIEDFRMYAAKNNRHFLNRLDYMIFGNATKPKRGNLKTSRIAAIEVGKERIHSHFLISCPSHISLALMDQYCSLSWERTTLGVMDIDIQQNIGQTYSESFGGYISKQINSQSTDAIDILNCNLPIKT